MARPRPAALLSSIRVVSARAMRGFLDARGLDLASGLAYSSLLSFVPLVASVTVLSSTLFGASGSGLYRLFSLVPGITAEFLGEIETFSTRARTLSGAATGLFLVSSLRAFLSVEGAADALWGSTTSRRPMQRLGVGLCVVVLGPVVGGVMNSLLLESGAPLTDLRFGGMFVSCLVLTLLYKTVPTSRVLWGPALSGGVFAGTGLALLRWGFSQGVALLTNVNVIYGSISAIAVFVLAIGSVWALLLLGVSLAHAVQFHDELVAYDEPLREARRAGPLEEAIRLLLLLARAADRTAGPVPLAALSDGIRRPEDDTHARLKQLTSAGLATVDEDGYRLARHAERISLYAVTRAVGEFAPRALPAGEDVTAATLRRILRRSEREVRGVLQGTSLRDLLDREDHAREGLDEDDLPGQRREGRKPAARTGARPAIDDEPPTR